MKTSDLKPLPMMEVYQRWGPKLAIECHCGFGHFLVFSVEPFNDGDELMWEVYILEEWRSTSGLWSRLKAAWRLFWTGAVHTASIGLNRHDVMKVLNWAESVLDRSAERRATLPSEQKFQDEEQARFNPGSIVVKDDDTIKVTMEPPNPGSDEAIQLGCLCPPMDNGYGDPARREFAGWVIVEGCLVHDKW